MSDNKNQFKVSFFDDAEVEHQLPVSLRKEGSKHIIELENPKKFRELLRSIMFCSSTKTPMRVISEEGSPAPVNLALETNEFYILDEDFQYL